MGEYSSLPLSWVFFIKTIKKPGHIHHLFFKGKTIFCVGSRWRKLFLLNLRFVLAGYIYLSVAGSLSFGGWQLTGFFLQVGSLKSSNLILSLLQIIMFGMGTKLSIKEFLTVLKNPKTIDRYPFVIILSSPSLVLCSPLYLVFQKKLRLVLFWLVVVQVVLRPL